MVHRALRHATRQRPAESRATWLPGPVKVVVAGGTGALGRRVCDDLAGRGHEVVVLTRQPSPGPHRQVGWDGVSAGDWYREVEGSAVVNLAGALVDRRPTPAAVALLTSSRVEPTLALAAAGRVVGRLPVLVQASTAAIYGDAGEAALDESSPIAQGPPQMAGVATAWERASAEVPAERTVVLRTSIVLDRDTPALDRLTGVVRWGLGGAIAGGQQWFSWIHVEDWLAVVRASLGLQEPAWPGPALDGVLLATAPHPVRNAELMRTLRTTLHRPPAPPTPAPLVRLGALVLRTDPALALTGRRVLPERLLSGGFAFRYPRLGPALQDLLPGRQRR